MKGPIEKAIASRGNDGGSAQLNETFEHLPAKEMIRRTYRETYRRTNGR